MKRRVFFIPIIFIIYLQLKCTFSHVSLSYPPARRVQIDFLSNVWTKKPCGVPKCKKGDLNCPITNLKSGAIVNVTWDLGYTHPGGHKFELLDKNGIKIYYLHPVSMSSPYDDYYNQGNTRKRLIANNFILNENESVQSETIQLPQNYTCDGCTIRFLRQTAPNVESFLFWSCADINLIKESSYKETCNGRGIFTNGKCNCYIDLHYGDKCQYENECINNFDCHNNGVCIKVPDSTNQPQKQCYCSQGFHGPRCSRKNANNFPRDLRNINMNTYTKMEVLLPNLLTMYFRILPNRRAENHEIEILLRANTTTWIGIGWRPLYLGPECRSFPLGEEYNPNVEFHPMDCVDVIASSVRRINKKNYIRINDYYTQGRHTPKSDSVWLNEAESNLDAYYDITNAIGWENPKKNETVIIFRRKLITFNSLNNLYGPDHTINSSMHFIYAVGQIPGVYYIPNSDEDYQIGPNQIQNHQTFEIPEFYTVDELKYHGTFLRGFKIVNFPSIENIKYNYAQHNTNRLTIVGNTRSGGNRVGGGGVGGNNGVIGYNSGSNNGPNNVLIYSNNCFNNSNNPVWRSLILALKISYYFHLNC